MDSPQDPPSSLKRKRGTSKTVDSKKTKGKEPAEVLEEMSVSVHQALTTASQPRSKNSLWCSYLEKELDTLPDADQENVRMIMEGAIAKIRRGEFADMHVLIQRCIYCFLYQLYIFFLVSTVVGMFFLCKCMHVCIFFFLTTTGQILSEDLLEEIVLWEKRRKDKTPTAQPARQATQGDTAGRSQGYQQYPVPYGGMTTFNYQPAHHQSQVPRQQDTFTSMLKDFNSFVGDAPLNLSPEKDNYPL